LCGKEECILIAFMLEGPFIDPILKNKNKDEINNQKINEKKERNNENIDDVKEKIINKVSIDIEGNSQIKTQSGRIIKKPERYPNDFGATNVDKLVDFETEKLLVGAAIGEGIGHTGELQSVKCNIAMSGPEKVKWKKEIVEEHDRMIQNAVWISVKLNTLPSNIKPLSITWVMKKESRGDFRARITAQGFLQEEGVHYRSDVTAAPLANETNIKIILIMLTLAEWDGNVIDVKGAFLKGRFNNGEDMYLQIPHGFEI
jgi:hypothetical protein